MTTYHVTKGYQNLEFRLADENYRQAKSFNGLKAFGRTSDASKAAVHSNPPVYSHMFIVTCRFLEMKPSSVIYVKVDYGLF